MRRRLGDWLAGRTPRERRLLAAAALAVALVGAASGGAAVRAHLMLARARVAASERELAAVRQLARALAETPRASAQQHAPLVARLEAVAADTVGRERIASMTPLAGDDEAVSLRLVGPSLADTVRLLHALEAAEAPARVRKLDMVKHPDDPARFDVVLEVTGGAP